MLTAERTDVQLGQYTITQESRMLTTITLERRGSGGRFDLDGASYRIRPQSLRRSYDLVGDGQSLVATAEGVRRRLWTVQADEQIYRFRRNSIRARGESLLDSADRPLGSIIRSGRWKVGAVGDLSGVDTRVQIFAIAVALVRWRQRQRTAAAVLGAANG